MKLNNDDDYMEIESCDCFLTKKISDLDLIPNGSDDGIDERATDWLARDNPKIPIIATPETTATMML